MTTATKPRAARRLVRRIRASQGLLLPWIFAFVLALVAAIVPAPDARWAWYVAVVGLTTIGSFTIQLVVGRSDGFILRTATAALGAVLIVGIVSVFTALFTAVASGLSFAPIG